MPSPHIFQATGTIFELVQYIIGTNLLTMIHDDQTIIMASRVLTRQNAPPLGGHYLLTKFHEDRTINVASRVKNAPPIGSHIGQYMLPLEQNALPPGGHDFKANETMFELIIGTNLLTIFFNEDMIRTKLLTKFHEDRKINVASRVLTRKNVPPPGSHVFQPTGIIFEIIQDIIGMNLLPINVASRVLTRFYYSHIKKNAPPLGSHTNLLNKFHEDWTINEKCPAPGGHVVKATKTIFELIQDIIGTNLLTKFNDDRKINVTSRVLTRKNVPPRGGHVFQPTFMMIGTLCSAPPLGGHVFQPTGTIFKLLQYIIGINVLTKFHNDRIINLASRVLLCKNALPPGDHVFKHTGTNFKIVQDFIGKNLLTKYNEDRTINVASSVLTRQILTTHDGQKAITKAHHEHIVLR
ncbi:hypothetical protein DPMN_006306 [Dreissena polymorpha]|uniref:Uncharacterized protein n=1 Tax=Dreissena polymorpha TaxID=45954 RepID=A0A9D4MUB5_DREPO|nr:hypothetical protein DPMN_006306 [Dreissena polymorpha]